MLEPFYVLDILMYNPYILIPIIVGVVVALCLGSIFHPKSNEYADGLFIFRAVIIVVGFALIGIVFILQDRDKIDANEANLKQWKQNVYAKWLQSLPSDTYPVIDIDLKGNVITYIDKNSNIAEARFNDEMLVTKTGSGSTNVTMVNPPKVDIDDIAVFEGPRMEITEFYSDLTKLTLSGQDPVPIYLEVSQR